jgi:hypothetical protein
MNDFNVSDHGTIWLLTPITAEAQHWVACYLPDDCPMMGESFAIEHRFIDAIVHGIQQDGLAI